MKKNKKSELQIPLRKEDLKWYSFEEIFKQGLKKKGFLEAYNAENPRLEIARQVRVSRAAKRMTQKAVAQKADMPQSVIARIESGRHDASLPTIAKIASALGKKVDVQLV